MADVLNNALCEIQTKPIPQQLIISKDDIVAEMIKNQRTVGIDPNKKLNQSDMVRIAKHVSISIFNPEHCSVWNGYITNFHNPNKGTYINFYFRKQKVALHRLLYYNFIANLGTTDYLKFKCDYKGYCCSINCLSKHRYSKNMSNTPSVSHKKIKPPPSNTAVIVEEINNNGNLFIHFV